MRKKRIITALIFAVLTMMLCMAGCENSKADGVADDLQSADFYAYYPTFTYHLQFDGGKYAYYEDYTVLENGTYSGTGDDEELFLTPDYDSMKLGRRTIHVIDNKITDFVSGVTLVKKE